ncbi:MAG: hypothetical protein WA418_33790 [Bradyrhizobium sp.]
MSLTRKIVTLGTLAASAMLVGAVQLASGHDLASELPVPQSDLGGLSAASTNVNRAGKSDRAGSVAEAVPTRTVSVTLSAFAETSFLLRLPVTSAGAPAGQVGPAQGSQIISTESERREAKRSIACEPSVSVLTEIAKRLQPGRCIT